MKRNQIRVGRFPGFLPNAHHRPMSQHTGHRGVIGPKAKANAVKSAPGAPPHAYLLRFARAYAATAFRHVRDPPGIVLITSLAKVGINVRCATPLSNQYMSVLAAPFSGASGGNVNVTSTNRYAILVIFVGTADQKDQSSHADAPIP